jgi:hypothetical protein
VIRAVGQGEDLGALPAEACAPALVALVTQCLQRQPTARPRMAQVVERLSDMLLAEPVSPNVQRQRSRTSSTDS